MIQQEGSEWVPLLLPERARTIAGVAIAVVKLEETVLRVGQPVTVDGFWAVGGTEPWSFLDDQGVRDRCPAKDYFFLTEIARP